MKKRVQKVLLPTNQKATGVNDLILISSWNKLQDMKNWNASNMDINDEIPQHLYFLSDEKPKEGDWCIKFGSIYKNGCILHQYSFIDKEFSDIVFKKIIATTDESLSAIPKGDTFNKLIPQPSQEFIQYYIEQYNAGNIIEWVEVEYELVESCLPMPNIHVRNDYYQLKINPNNTINISPIKDSWNREEVVELCKSAFITGSRINDITFDKWISENLSN